MTSGWEAPKEMSEEDKLELYLSKARPSNSTLFLATALLTNIQFVPEVREEVQKQGRETYIEMTRNLLTGLKHTATMDAAAFALEYIVKLHEKHGDKLPADEVLYVLAKMAEMAKQASLKSLTVAQNLAGLYGDDV